MRHSLTSRDAGAEEARRCWSTVIGYETLDEKRRSGGSKDKEKSTLREPNESTMSVRRSDGRALLLKVMLMVIHLSKPLGLLQWNS